MEVLEGAEKLQELWKSKAGNLDCAVAGFGISSADRYDLWSAQEIVEYLVK